MFVQAVYCLFVDDESDPVRSHDVAWHCCGVAYNDNTRVHQQVFEHLIHAELSPGR